MSSFDGDSFKIVTAGQPVRNSARRENLLSEVAKEFMSRRGGGIGGSGTILAPEIPGMVLIKNTTGDAVGKFGVLGIDGLQINHDQNPEFFESGFLFKGITPAAPDHLGKFVVLAEPINNGEIGRGFLQGTFPAKVNILKENDRYCDVMNGDSTQLQSGGGGAARILYAPSGTGTKWCIIRVGGESRPVEMLQILSAADEGGTYNVYVVRQAASDIPAGDNFDATVDLGTPLAEDALAVNLKESGAATHELVDDANTDDRYAIGLYLWTNADGTKVFAIDKIWLGCPPDTTPSDWV
jgi:hypothetical protein